MPPRVHIYGTLVHDEFDAWLEAQWCGCGSRFFCDTFPKLMCERGHAARVVVAIAEAP